MSSKPEVGTIVWASVQRRRWTADTPHLVYVDHAYGPENEHRYVIPLCGVDGGRHEKPWKGDAMCQRCLKIEADGRQTERRDARLAKRSA